MITCDYIITIVLKDVTAEQAEASFSVLEDQAAYSHSELNSVGVEWKHSEPTPGTEEA